MRRITLQSAAPSSRKLSTIKRSAIGRPDCGSKASKNNNLSLRRIQQLSHVHGPAWRYLNTEIDHTILRQCLTPSEPSSTADPLEIFLATHEDEGPAIAAMWTSLHRSCTQHSEITEAAVLAVRQLFHRLVRSRAFHAAAQLYRQVVECGLALKRNDVLLLLANLPYEKSVGSSKELAQDSWMKSDETSSWKRKKQAEALKDPKKDPPAAASQPKAQHNTSPTMSPHCSNRWIERLRVYETAMGRTYTAAEDEVPASYQSSDQDQGTLSFADHSQQSNWAGAEVTSALLHHLCFVHAQRPKSVVSDSFGNRDVWAEALHVISSRLTPQRNHITFIPSVVTPAVAQTLRIVPRAMQWKVALRFINASVRTVDTLEQDLLRVLCVQITPGFASVIGKSPRVIKCLRRSVETLQGRLRHSALSAESTRQCMDALLLIDSCRSLPSSNRLIAVHTKLVEMLGALTLECKRFFESDCRETLGSATFVDQSLQDNIALCSVVLRSAANFVGVSCELTGLRHGGHTRSLEDIVQELFLGSSGLLALHELMFTSKHRNAAELKAIKNAPERNGLLESILEAGLAWLLVLPAAQSQHRCVVTPWTVSEMMRGLAEVVCSMNLSSNRGRVGRLVCRAVAAVLRRFGLNCRGTHSTVGAALVYRVQTDQSILQLCTAAIRLFLTALPFKSRSSAVSFLRSRTTVHLVLTLCSPRNAVGVRIRSQLAASEVKHLDRFVTLVQANSRSQIHTCPSSTSPSLMRDVYRIASLSQSDSDKSIALEGLLNEKSNWFHAASLARVVIAGVRIHRNAVSPAFCQAAFKSLSVPQCDEYRPPVAAWSTAMQIFWYAMDNLSTDDVAKKKDFLDSSILLLIRLSRACGLYNEARRFNVGWQKFHALHSDVAQLGSDAFLLKRLENAVELRERDILQRLLYFLDHQATSPSLKSSLSRLVLDATRQVCQHSSWVEAIRVISSHPNFLSTSGGAHAYLICLDQAGSNLCYSCEKVFRAHSNRDWWGAEHSALVLRSFAKARRWKEALVLFSSPAHLELHLKSEDAIKEGLRACASAGRAETAETLFAAFKRLENTSAPTRDLAKSLFLRAVTKGFTSPTPPTISVNKTF